MRGRGLQLDKSQVCAPLSPETSSTADIGHLQWSYLPRKLLCKLDSWQGVAVYIPQSAPTHVAFSLACFTSHSSILLLVD